MKPSHFPFIGHLRRYMELMREFPIDQLLMADTIEQLTKAVQDIFQHLKRVKKAQYPVSRAKPPCCCLRLHLAAAFAFTLLLPSPSPCCCLRLLLAAAFAAACAAACAATYAACATVFTALLPCVQLPSSRLAEAGK